VEKAKAADIPQMHRLINSFAEKEQMLHRSMSELYENIRDFFVIRQGEQVVACAALHVSWSDLAEIKSLAVTENNQNQGLGTRLVEACLVEAREVGIPTVFCLTYRTNFFERFGFFKVDKMELPRKIWSECYKCPKFPNCDEVALIHHLET